MREMFRSSGLFLSVSELFDTLREEGVIWNGSLMGKFSCLGSVIQLKLREDIWLSL